MKQQKPCDVRPEKICQNAEKNSDPFCKAGAANSGVGL